MFVLAVYEQEYLVGGGGDATDEGDVVRVEFEGEAGGQVVVGVEGPDHVLVVVRHHEPIGPVARHHVQHVTRDWNPNPVSTANQNPVWTANKITLTV